MSQAEKDSKKKRLEEESLYQKMRETGFARYLIENAGLYMVGAIEYAHRGKVDKYQFWENLFVLTGKEEHHCILMRKPSLKVQQKHNKAETYGPSSKERENPYGEMDFQACNKYLCHGEKRAGIEDDSQYVFQLFGNDYGNRKSERAYKNALFDAIDLRNKYMHGTRSKMAEINAAVVRRDMKTLWDVISPFEAVQKKSIEQEDPVDFGMAQPIEEFRQEMEALYKQMFGYAPICVSDLKLELFAVDSEESLTEEQEEAWNYACEILKLDVRGGYVYDEPSQSNLMMKLRLVTPKTGMTQDADLLTDREAAEEQVKLLEEEQKSRMLDVPEVTGICWTPLSAQTSREVLSVSRHAVHLGEQEIAALDKSFHILLDETVFLSEYGRRGLEEALLPAMKKQNLKLMIDTSVIAALFRDFRNTAPYTPEQLAELEYVDEVLLEERKKQHESCREGINQTLRHLRKAGVLEIGASLVDSEYSEENIWHLVKSNPKERFLVLTDDRHMVDELSRMPGKNAVAGKLSRNGMTGAYELVLYGATQGVWCEMVGLESNLQRNPPAENVEMPQEDQPIQSEQEVAELLGMPQAAVKQDHTRLSVSTVPEEEDWSGSKVIVEPWNGMSVSVVLGEKLGEGGEGGIYSIAEPEEFAAFAAKIYKTARLTQGRLNKLEYELAHDPQIPELCWPKAKIFTQKNEWIGFIMPRAEGEPLARSVYHPGPKGSTIKENLGWGRRELVEAAANIAGVFAKMHQSGILMGDVNPGNILVSKDCAVRFVDCDSYQIDNSPCPVAVLRYVPPEIHREMGDQVQSGFTRSAYHEQYSMAVILFETLMLGKAPYTSRTTQRNQRDVITAIVEGYFPYVFRRAKEKVAVEIKETEQQEQLNRETENRGLKAPVGSWTTIWSHMPYEVREGFFDTFTDVKRRSAVEWERRLRKYEKLISDKKHSGELMPLDYKMLEDSDSLFVECEHCKNKFQILRSVLNRLQSEGKPVYCPRDDGAQRSMDRLSMPVPCSQCGREYQEKEIRLMEDGFVPLCENCGTISDVDCDYCGKTFSMKKGEYKKLTMQKRMKLCDKCRNQRATCSQCGGEFRTDLATLDWLNREGRPALCKKCRGRREPKQ